MRIAVFNQKGGVGKTTTTLNLAASIFRAGGKPLLLDIDPQCHLSAIHGSTPEEACHSLFGFYQGVRALDELTIPWEGIGRLIPSHRQLVKVDSLFGKGPTILNKLRRGLDQIDEKEHDHTRNGPEILNRLRLGLDNTDETIPGNAAQTTLIDCCPYVGVLALNAVFACDMLLIPISTDYMSLQAADQMTRTLSILEPVLKRRIERRYLLTRYDRRRKMSEDVLNILHQRYGREVCQTVISENVSVAESPSKKRDVFSHNPASVGAKDYNALHRELRLQGFV